MPNPTDLRPAVDRHVKAYNGEIVSQIPHIPVAASLTVTTIATAGAVTYTPAQLIGGLILRDCAGAGRADVLPTGAEMLAAMPGAFVGQRIRFGIRNTSAGATTITVTAPASGGTLSGTMTIAQNNSRVFLLRIDALGSSAAYTLYNEF